MIKTCQTCLHEKVCRILASCEKHASKKGVKVVVTDCADYLEKVMSVALHTTSVSSILDTVGLSESVSKPAEPPETSNIVLDGILCLSCNKYLDKSCFNNDVCHSCGNMICDECAIFVDGHILCEKCF